jgi:hypothetical protein
MRTFHFLAAAAAAGSVAAPISAQTPYPYGYPQQQVPQPYPGQPGYGYGQPAYNQGYGQNPIEQIINQLLGNRYNVSDRQAVSRCASAAMVQAQNEYRGYDQRYGGYQQGYGQPNGYGQRFAVPAMRVTSITEVRRRGNGLRVSGLMSSGYGGNYAYNGQYPDQTYAAGDLSFRCNVDYRGAVSNVRISRNMASRRY